MAVINEIGNRYGRLSVLERAKNNHRGEAQWLCQCDCGNQVIVKGVSLRTGHTRSCGCLQKEKVRQTGLNNTVNLLGQRFGKLVVIERIPGNKDKLGEWKCQCDCGSYTIVPTVRLLNGHTKSCGCMKSSGEFAIATYLNEHNYNFSREYSFADLKRIRRLRFDFAVFNNNNQLQLLIEYDGPQHTNQHDGFYDEDIIQNDRAKDAYCQLHNIPLYRINYDENIEEKLNEIFDDIS